MDPNSGAVQPASAAPAGAPYNQMVNPPNVAMVSVNNLLNVKDSRWLQLEVCREFQRNKCTRPDTECKFAHPLPNVEVQNGRVTACYDSIKGRCNREKPPCKYFHPPQHLKDQLLINGRNHLALKNALMTQIHGLPPTTSVMPGTLQMVSSHVTTAPSGDRHGRWGSDQLQAQHHPIYQPAASPYLQGIPTMGSYGPYLASSSPVMTVGGVNDGMTSQLPGVLPQQVLTQKLPRTDRLEVCREFQRGACKRPEEECRFAHPPEHVASSDEGTVTVCMDAVKSRCARDPCRYFHPPSHLQAHLKAGRATAAAAAAAAVVSSLPGAFPGVLPYKRTATDKSGVPMFQPGNAAYQQALMQQLGNQSYVPVSFAGHPASMPRF